MAAQTSRPPAPPPLSSPITEANSPASCPVGFGFEYRRSTSLKPPSKSKPSASSKLLKGFCSIFRSFPIISPTCKFPVVINGARLYDNHIHGGAQMAGTVFGYRKARVNLAIQENPKCLPFLALELAITTGRLLQDMRSAMVRIALECEKRPSEKIKLMNEPIWTLYCNGKKSGYAVKRETTDEDLMVMQTLRPVSMGAGMIPMKASPENPNGELAYMRAHFERVVNSRDSETYYMMNPDGNSEPELSLFFVRIG